MKSVNKIARFCCCLMVGGMSLHLWGPKALAAESSGGWRLIYDEVLLWINFGIIVFVFVKYGKTPLMNFLLGRKEKLAQEIERIEENKEKAADKVKEIHKMLDESNIRFANLKDRIVEQGEKKRQEIIEEAKQQSKIMLEGAKRKIDNQILQAKNRLKSELVDAATALATKKLPDVITEEDNKRLLNQYLDSILKE